jgi:hypothetical protein
VVGADFQEFRRMSTVLLSDLKPLRTWQSTHAAQGGEVFKTFASLEWFVRQHRDHLITHGALIPQRGARGSMVTPEFEKIALELLRR